MPSHFRYMVGPLIGLFCLVSGSAFGDSSHLEVDPIGGSNRAVAVSVQASQSASFLEAMNRHYPQIQAAADAGFYPSTGNTSLNGAVITNDSNWFFLRAFSLQQGVPVRFVTAGDDGVVALDMRIENSIGEVVAESTGNSSAQTVNFTPTQNGRYSIRIRVRQGTTNNRTRHDVVTSVLVRGPNPAPSK